jgi:FtsP/CotA-like multicopper oxidase with cupredoxin domain
MHHHGGHRAGGSGAFPTDVEGLPEAVRTPIVEVADGDSYELRIAPVRKRIDGAELRLLAYNGSVPGPTFHVRQGSEITVHVTNDAELEQTVHWHGLRLENRFDGVPHETQQPIAAGGTFSYRLRFPDAGLFWYHPHVREDYGQELGLYANILVEPDDAAHWPPVNRELVVTLDDILLEDGRVAPFSRSGATHVAMGRFGNVILVNGGDGFELDVARGEVVRLYVTNTANARTFNVRLPGALMKLVGADNGRWEREELVDAVLVAPSERAIVDVLFETPGGVPFEHATPDRVYELGRVRIRDEAASPSYVDAFAALRVDPALRSERERLALELERPPDKTLALVGTMDHGGMGHAGHGGGHALEHAHAPDDGIEWEDTMPEMNVMSHGGNMAWKLIDRDTGAENAAIDWSFRVGERVKVRLVNEPASDHPMQHPFHVHGEAFLVLARDGVPEANLAWKDTVLVRAGETVDILLALTNPGLWMAHCHIAEHTETGMMFSFRVVP